MKLKSTASAMKRRSLPMPSLLLLPLLLLTGCALGSSHVKESLPASSELYQPPLLRLKAGQQIQTRDGVYRPQIDEVWHSDARYRHLEQQALAATEALAALKGQSK